MNQDKVQTLINRYLKMFPLSGIDSKKIDYIESRLEVILPTDFIRISSVFDGYEEIAHQSFFSLNPETENWNIITQTEFYRNSDCNLPKKYVALREEGESFIIMETQLSRLQPAPVIWCSTIDAYNLQDNKLIDNPIIYSSFSDYFEFLLNEEELLRSTF